MYGRVRTSPTASSCAYVNIDPVDILIDRLTQLEALLRKAHSALSRCRCNEQAAVVCMELEAALPPTGGK